MKKEKKEYAIPTIDQIVYWKDEFDSAEIVDEIEKTEVKIEKINVFL